MAKRATARKQASPKPTTANGLADKVAITFGSTLGRLMNRKNALLKQLSEVETKIASASRRAGDQLKAYLPASVPGLKGRRKTKNPATKRPRSARPAPPSPATHGRDDATAETMRAVKTPSARARRSTAPPPSAARATRRG
jgi:hypothetical protein